MKGAQATMKPAQAALEEITEIAFCLALRTLRRLRADLSIAASAFNFNHLTVHVCLRAMRATGANVAGKKENEAINVRIVY